MIAVRGRIEDDVFRISVFGSEVALLPMHVDSDEHGRFAVLTSGDQRFENGLVLSVRAQAARVPRKEQPRKEKTKRESKSGDKSEDKSEAKRDDTRARRVLLSLRSESPAMPLAKPLFGKLGGDPDLVRLIAPSSWSVELSFDAEGRYVERTRPRSSGRA